MVRTPSKPTDPLKGKGIEKRLPKSQIPIIKGNANDMDAVHQALADEDGRLVQQVVFDIGWSIPSMCPFHLAFHLSN